MIKVEATKEWKNCNLKCKDFRPERIPNEGEQWEINESRLEVLLGNNSYGKVFVKVVEELAELHESESIVPIAEIERLEKENTIEQAIEIIKETTKEKPVKKTTTKKQLKKK